MHFWVGTHDDLPCRPLYDAHSKEGTRGPTTHLQNSLARPCAVLSYGTAVDVQITAAVAGSTLERQNHIRGDVVREPGIAF